MKKIGIGIGCALLLCGMTALTGCGSEPSAPSASEVVSSEAVSETTSSEAISSVAGESTPAQTTLELGDQLKKPEIGEEIAVIETTQGAIKMRLFPQAAPKTVKNFKQLAESGFYDGLDFHRIIDGFMIQTGQGSADDSIYGGSFEDEFSDALLNLRGAVSMANTGVANTNTTQFFINQTTAEQFAGNGGWDYMKQGYEVYQSNPDGFTQTYGAWVDLSKAGEKVEELYTKYGGSPTLDGAYSTTGRGHTVFGQVFEGMDVVDKIAKAKVDSNNAPISEDYKIESVSFTTYEG